MEISTGIKRIMENVKEGMCEYLGHARNYFPQNTKPGDMVKLTAVWHMV
jgi:hypothetical protein